MEMTSKHQFVIAKKKEGAPALVPTELHPEVLDSTNKDVWTLLLGFRLINALLVRTFFQPDEYFQSLEPAWQMVFGPESGAWITWVGTSQPLNRLLLMRDRNGNTNFALHYILRYLQVFTTP